MGKCVGGEVLWNRWDWVLPVYVPVEELSKMRMLDKYFALHRSGRNILGALLHCVLLGTNK